MIPNLLNKMVFKKENIKSGNKRDFDNISEQRFSKFKDVCSRQESNRPPQLNDSYYQVILYNRDNF